MVYDQYWYMYMVNQGLWSDMVYVSLGILPAKAFGQTWSRVSLGILSAKVFGQTWSMVSLGILSAKDFGQTWSMSVLVYCQPRPLVRHGLGQSWYIVSQGLWSDMVYGQPCYMVSQDLWSDMVYGQSWYTASQGLSSVLVYCQPQTLVRHGLSVLDNAFGQTWSTVSLVIW